MPVTPLPSVTQFFAPSIAKLGKSSHNVGILFRDIRATVDIRDNVEQEGAGCFALAKMRVLGECLQWQEQFPWSAANGLELVLIIITK